MTNADRIRAMSDEELAGFLCSNEWGRIPKSEKGWLDWLRQEAAEPPKDHPSPICQTCGNFETCAWHEEGIFSGPKDKARRVVECSDYKDTKG